MKIESADNAESIGDQVFQSPSGWSPAVSFGST